MAEILTGYVEKIVFRNAENGYTVLSLAQEGEEITCVGTFPFINEGELVEMAGGFISHAVYGEQFQVSGFQIKESKDRKSIEKYLGSGTIKGIGPALAARIVSRFKEETFRIIEEEPERLAEVKGISKKSAGEIYKQFVEKKELRSAHLFLSDYGISTNLAVKIYKHYGMRLYQVVGQNPYQLAEDIPGVGFKTADEIASKGGLLMDSDFRIRASVLYALSGAAGNGNVYLPETELLHTVFEILGMRPEDMERHIRNLAVERKLIVKEALGEKRIYLASYYYLELNCARMLKDLNVKYEVPKQALWDKLCRIEEGLKITLDDMQRQAVASAVQNGLLILTGGPGTGKTTTINAMIRFFETEGMDILLAAPTGRAAKRMSETTGHEAKTIHRLLEIAKGPAMEERGSDEKLLFQRNEENPLECDVIIIDEMSMVDISLMHAVLRAVSVGTRLILVGDENQLPSVGPGNVLHDIIASQAFATIRLLKIFRQADESDIIVNAHKIHAGEQIRVDNKSRDFFLLQRNEINAVIGVIVSLVRDKIPKYVNAEPYEIQVLTPMRKGELGVEKLNQVLQQYLNPPAKDKKEKEYQGILFREGDKVMQVKNNYQIEWEVRNQRGIRQDAGMGIFNGDMGIIKEINLFSEYMEIAFEEGRMVEYPFAQLEELEQAYAVTIHKSQGSEYPAVVIPLLAGPKMLMNRNILYTAVTRAKSCVTIVGSADIVKFMISNEREQKRYSGLDLCICEILS